MSKRGERLVGLAALTAIGLVVFAPAMSFPPTDGDDLTMLSAVARAPTPFRFFTGDWGLGNHSYRPIHSASIWAIYQMVGVTAGDNQVINLSLHLTIVWLLYGIIRSIQPDRTLAFLFAATSLVSPYTFSAATWVSDRPTLWVAICLLSLVRLLGVHRADGSPPSAPWLLAGCMALALLSKESGLVLPGLTCFWAFTAGRSSPTRRAAIGVSVGMAAGYAAWRLLIFGSHAAMYSKGGMLLGVWHYQSWADLPQGLALLALMDNAAKNIVAPFMVVFDNEGGLLSAGGLLRLAPVWAPTLVLAVMMSRRQLTPGQQAGLAIIALNGLVHYALFRHRVLYLAQLGIALYFAGAMPAASRVRLRLITSLAGLSLVANMYWTGDQVRTELAVRRQMLTSETLRTRYPAVDSAIVDQVITQYAR